MITFLLTDLVVPESRDSMEAKDEGRRQGCEAVL